MFEVDANGLAAEAWRMSRWMWLPAICELAEHLRGQAWWPHYVQLP
jgi:hypothetical protein